MLDTIIHFFMVLGMMIGGGAVLVAGPWLITELLGGDEDMAPFAFFGVMAVVGILIGIFS